MFFIKSFVENHISIYLFCSDIGYVCMIFHQRDSQIIEIQQSGEQFIIKDNSYLTQIIEHN